MNDVINTYKPCDEHANGHSEHCEKCETEAVRDIVRKFANSQLLGTANDPRAMVYIVVDRELWDSVAGLRR